jgi:hypothetical protein
LLNDKDHIENLDSLLNLVMRGQGKMHREALVKESKKRDEKKREELRL